MCVDGSIILKLILNKIAEHKIDFFGSVLGEVEVFQNIRGDSWVAEDVLASEEVLCSVQLD